MKYTNHIVLLEICPCSGLVLVLFVLCKELFGVLEGVRIPPPSTHTNKESLTA